MGEAAGNGTKAAKLAGYKGTSQVLSIQASRLLDKANVLGAMDAHRGVLKVDAIADLAERRAILTKHARGDDRMASIKATEVLNKMDGVYIERHQHEGGLTVDVMGARERLMSTLARIAGASGRL